MLSSQEEQIEREATMRNDASVREQQKQREAAQRDQSSTFHQHAQSQANDEAGGRFAAVNPATVVGAQPLPTYPQLPSSSPWPGAQPEPGIEPPLGYDNPALEPSAALSPVVEEGAPVTEALSSGVQAPPLPADDVETGTGAPPFSPVGGPAPASHLLSGPARIMRDAGPSSNKDADNG
jgi:hypothetical protein